MKIKQFIKTRTKRQWWDLVVAVICMILLFVFWRKAWQESTESVIANVIMTIVALLAFRYIIIQREKNK